MSSRYLRNPALPPYLFPPITVQKEELAFLKDIPLVGWLFRSTFNPATNKKELIIFITPRIINQEEAGLVDRG